jgi:hypothetical protein
MVKSKFQIGSNTKFRKLAKLCWRDNRLFGKFSLAGISTASRTVCRWICKINLIKLLKGMKLVVEIIEKIRTLIFCQQSHFLLKRWVQNKTLLYLLCLKSIRCESWKH